MLNISTKNSKFLFNINISKSNEQSSELRINISEIVIPFSKVFKSYKPTDIYSGNENIPFKERDPEFKLILAQEFSKI